LDARERNIIGINQKNRMKKNIITYSICLGSALTLAASGAIAADATPTPKPSPSPKAETSPSPDKPDKKKQKAVKPIEAKPMKESGKPYSDAEYLGLLTEQVKEQQKLLVLGKAKSDNEEILEFIEEISEEQEEIADELNETMEELMGNSAATVAGNEQVETKAKKADKKKKGEAGPHSMKTLEGLSGEDFNLRYFEAVGKSAAGIVTVSNYIIQNSENEEVKDVAGEAASIAQEELEEVNEWREEYLDELD